MQPELPKRFDRGAQSLDRAFIMFFQRDDALLRAGLLHHQTQPLHNLSRIKLHHLLIDPQKRLALRAVDDDGPGLAVDLYMRREPRAARAQDSGVHHHFLNIHI